MFISPGDRPGRKAPQSAALAPAQLGGLVYWVDASTIAAPAGGLVTQMLSPDPIRCSTIANNGSSACAVATSPINGLPAVTFPNSSTTGFLTLGLSYVLASSTCFVVHRPGTMANSTSYTLLGSSSGTLQFRIEGTGTNVGKLGVLRNSVGGGGTSNAVLATGTPFQGNVTWDSAGGAYAFRIGGSAQGSGSSASTVANASGLIGKNSQSNNETLNGDLGELIIYNRILSAAEIATIEAYLYAKWGV